MNRFEMHAYPAHSALLSCPVQSKKKKKPTTTRQQEYTKSKVTSFYYVRASENAKESHRKVQCALQSVDVDAKCSNSALVRMRACVCVRVLSRVFPPIRMQ